MYKCLGSRPLEHAVAKQQPREAHHYRACKALPFYRRKFPENLIHDIIKMSLPCKALVALLLLSVVNARPNTEFGSTNQSEPVDLENTDPLENVDTAAQTPQVYLIIAESLDDPEIIGTPADEDDVEKRSAEESDDLETAAGTNVLRPLFVYRQQLAYRERVKKGAFRRSGIRPRF
ncbi:uncharacterized protein LOC100677900 [Nasonia vitripennis]|uniref:Uncharacterized protein n=1 Tax=Nasonia vitripennis TaxID=7425 RepID=A0A7M7LNC7_NASVI|nr:uncharacterized protein LOC100677900 [Nasonia vitripennis]